MRLKTPPRVRLGAQAIRAARSELYLLSLYLLSEQAARSERLSKAGRTDEAIYLARAVARGSPYGALGPRLVRTP